MDKIEEAIESLPKGAAGFLLSFAPMSTNKEIAKLLKERRPLCMLIAVGKFEIDELSTLYNKLRYEDCLDDHIIIHNAAPKQFIAGYGKSCTAKFSRIFADEQYSDLSKMMLKNGKIIIL